MGTVCPKEKKGQDRLDLHPIKDNKEKNADPKCQNCKICWTALIMEQQK